MEKNCTGSCNAVMTKSHDLAEFVRGAQIQSSHFPYLTGAPIVASDRSRNGVGDFRIHSFILTTFTGISNDENSDSVVSLRGYRVPTCRCRYLQPSIFSFSLIDFRSRLTAGVAFPRGIVGSVNGENDTGA
jgi:hypothetical protein